MSDTKPTTPQNASTPEAAPATIATFTEALVLETPAGKLRFRGTDHDLSIAFTCDLKELSITDFDTLSNLVDLINRVRHRIGRPNLIESFEPAETEETLDGQNS